MRLFRRKTSSSDYEVVGDPQLTGLRFESSSSHHQSETQFNVPNNNNDDAISIATAPTPVPPLIMDSPRSLKKISSGKKRPWWATPFFWIFAPNFCLTGLVACYNNTEDDETVWWIVRPLPYLNEGSDLPNLLLGWMKRTRQITLACLKSLNWWKNAWH